MSGGSARAPSEHAGEAEATAAGEWALSRAALPASVRLFGVPLHRHHLFLLLGDLLVLASAVAAGYFLRVTFLGWIGAPAVPRFGEVVASRASSAVIFVASVLLFLYLLDCYSPRLDFRRPAAMLRLCAAVGAAAVIQMAIYYLAPSLRWWRGETLFTLAALLPLLLLWRVAIFLAIDRHLGPVRVLIVGSGESARAMARVLEDRGAYGRAYELVQSVVEEGGQQAADSAGPAAVTATDLETLALTAGVREIVVAHRSEISPATAKALLTLKSRGVAVSDLPSAYRRITGKVPLAELSDAWIVFGPEFRGVRPLYRGLLRLADLFIAGTGLILALPLLAAAGLAIKASSRGPVLFSQERAGLNEQPFRLLKLRTMRHHAEQETGPVWSQGDSDPRVTLVGRFLRRSRLDELPQLWNVLRNDMSMVGPRPERPVFVARLKERIPYYGLRFAVKPGLTGWAQVEYRYGASEEDAAEKLQYELYSIQEMSPALYFLILLKTLQVVLLRPGS